MKKEFNEINNLIKSIFYSTIVILLVGCSTSRVNFKNDQLIIQSSNTTSVYNGHLLSRHTENFSTLFIDQKILQLPQGDIIVYEHARTDLQYEFEPTIHRIIKYVFETNKMVPVYMGSQLAAYQIALPNGQWLNLLAQRSDTQELYFIYGMSTSKFNKMIRGIDENAPSAFYKNVIKLNKQQAVQSRWTMKKVHFIPLVVPYTVSLFR